MVAVSRAHRPVGIRYALTRRWLAVTRALATTLRARLILGVNLEADSPRVASAEARAMVRGVGRRWIEALELGNEPELYGAFALVHRGGRKIFGRGPHYDFSKFLPDYSRIARALPRVPLAGPATGSLRWMAHLRRFIAAQPRLGLVTLHRYPLKQCGTRHVVTIDELLTESSAAGLADSLAPYIAVAHARGLPVRIDEINSVSCGGERGVSDTFASALWSIDALFELARVGADGVNIHTRPRSSNRLFTIGRRHGQWAASVDPEYYGLMLFAQAAPRGSRLLRTARAMSNALRVWATYGPDGRVRVVLINKSPSRARLVSIRDRSALGAATLELLTAPELAATADVTLGGQRFRAHRSTGRLVGPSVCFRVSPSAGRYVVSVPPASAALLTIPGQPG